VGGGLTPASWALVLLALAGCKLDLTGARCNTNDNCPGRQFCSVPDGAKQGTCRPGERFEATLALTATPAILPAGGTTQAFATLSTSGGPAVPDGGLVTELVDWSVAPGSEGLLSVSNDAGTRGLVQALAPGEGTLLGSILFSDQRVQSSTRVVVSNAALQRIVPVADRLQYAPATRGSASATGFFSDGTHADLTSLVTWASSAPGVLTVSNAAGSWGGIAALAPGQASLRASYLDLTGTTAVTVGAAALIGLAISPPDPRGLAGSDLPLEATGVFSDGTAQSMTGSVQWSVDDQSVGYFARPGVVTLLAPGSTTVRALAGALQIVAALEIVPAAPAQLEISPAWPDPMLVGSDLQLSAFLTHADGTVAPTVAGWSSSGPALAVTPFGDLAAVSPGQSTVLASTGAFEARALVESTADAGLSWLVWPVESVVPVGAEGRLALERAHADGTVQDLTTVAGWREADGDAGTVDVETGESGGTVRPRQPGARVPVLGVLPGRSGRGWVRAPEGIPTLEIVPPAGALPMRARTRLAAVAHWPDGTVVDVTSSASWTAAPEGVLVAGDGPTAGLLLGADGGVSTVRARFGGATAQAPVQVEPQTGTLEVWPPAATLAAGTALPLAVTLVSASGESTDVTSDAVWISSVPRVALATNAPGQQGELLCQAPGATLLTARMDGLQTGLRVQVTGATLQGLDILPPAALVTWAPARFAVRGRLSDGATQDLTRWVSWTSSGATVLRVRGTGADRGRAQGLAPGSVVVTARPRGGPPTSVPAEVNGTVLASISVLGPPGPMAAGTRARLQALGRGADGTTVDVTAIAEWTSSAPGVALVSSIVRPGWVTTIRSGATTIAARLSGVLGTADLQISSDTPVGLSIFAPSTLRAGSGATAFATATLSGGGSERLDEDVVWSSDAPGVLGVSNAPGGRGRIFALEPGTATLRARTRAGIAPVQASTVITVSSPALRSHPPTGSSAAE